MKFGEWKTYMETYIQFSSILSQKMLLTFREKKIENPKCPKIA
jgi:hypothetical protein